MASLNWAADDYYLNNVRCEAVQSLRRHCSLFNHQHKRTTTWIRTIDRRKQTRSDSVHAEGVVYFLHVVWSQLNSDAISIKLTTVCICISTRWTMKFYSTAYRQPSGFAEQLSTGSSHTGHVLRRWEMRRLHTPQCRLACRRAVSSVQYCCSCSTVLKLPVSLNVTPMYTHTTTIPNSISTATWQSARRRWHQNQWFLASRKLNDVEQIEAECR